MKLILDDKEIKELPLPTISTEGVVIVPKPLGRPEGDKNLSRLQKKVIAAEANAGVKQKDLAKIHDISQAEVSIIERGYNATNVVSRKVDEEIRDIGLQTKNKIVDRATTKLMRSLDLFDPDAMENKHLPDAAVKLASVVDKISGGQRDSAGPGVVFQVYAPRILSESHFEKIVLNER